MASGRGSCVANGLRVASKASLKESTEDLRQELLQRLIDQRLMGPSLQVSMNFEPEQLPLRELPHRSWSELYLMLQSYCRVKDAVIPSRATFFQMVQRWKVCLRFHKKTQHAQCATCSRLRAAIQACNDFREEAKLSDILLAHFTRTWKDRQVYWLARDRARVQRDMLVIIVDSFDHGKMVLPTYPKRRTPKLPLFEGTRRALADRCHCQYVS